MDFSNVVWERTGYDTMSRKLFILFITMFSFLGILVSFSVSTFTANLPINWITALIVLAFGIVGIILAYSHDRPIVSFIGYMLVAIPYGALLGPLVNSAIPADLAKAFFVTTAYVVVFGLVGLAIPDDLSVYIKFIIGGLIVALLGSLMIPMAGFFGVEITSALRFWDWVVIGFFAIVITVDFNRANHVPATVDNAIDIAIAIYLDWFNVFVRAYNLLKGKSD